MLISNTPGGRPSPPVIDTQIESGRHLTFVLMAQHVAPGTEPYPPYVAQVKAARDSLRALAEREGVYYSTVGVATQWDIVEGQRVLNAYGHFDEVSLGRNWFNNGRFRYKGSTVPAVLVFLEDIVVEQTSWTSLRLREVARFEGRRSMREWAARGFSLNIGGPDIEAPDSATSVAPSDNSPAAPTAPAPVAPRPNNSSPAIWRLDSDVLATAGSTEADPLYRVVGAAVTEHYLIVAEASTGNLRFYTHAGTLEKTVGRQGEGPGEYRNMGWMRRVEDQLHAYDRPSNKVEVYSLDGSPVRTTTVRPHDELPLTSVVGAFADGSLLAIGSASPMYVPDEPETRRAPMTLVRHDSGGAPADRLIDIVGPERYFEPWGRGGVRQMSRPFGRVTGVGVVASGFVVMDNDSHAIAVYGRDGVRQGTFEPNPVPPMTPVMQKDIELVRERLLADADETVKRFVEGMIRATGFPGHRPPYGWLALEPGARRPPLIVADGLVFALRYGGIEPSAGRIAGPEWFVFRPEEGHAATLTSPDDVRLFDLAGDLAAVLRKTELGEEVVELRRVLGRN
ncbi:MAG: hypothetical protein F4086_18300 [Gemmatimonadetes bacterium]|nr:hypothetical protein [Gemmatimonadota bacterium]